MNWQKLISDHAEITIFLSILLGHFIGKVRVGHFSLGSVVGTLLAGLLIGVYTKPEIPEILRWSFFDLFLFTIGYSVGPQFFASFRKAAIPQIITTVAINVSSLLAVCVVSFFLKFDTGTTAGILSGSLTQSAAMGTSISAINELPVSPELKTQYSVNVPIADAITYIFGDIGLIMMMVILLPALFKINLKEEARKLEESLKQGLSVAADSFFKSPGMESVRAHVLQNEKYAGQTVKQIETTFHSSRLYMRRLVRSGQILPFDESTILQKGDILTFMGWVSGFLSDVKDIGPEVADREALGIQNFERKIFVTNKPVSGMRLADLAEQHGRGLFLNKITRGTVELLPSPDLEIQRGDILYVLGSKEDLDRATHALGATETDPKKSDLAFMGLCIALGIVAGLLYFQVNDIPMGLGASGSILVVGLIAGWAQKKVPFIGSIPQAAQQLLIDIGLIVFIAIIGLKAGPHAVDAIKTGGVEMVLKIFLAGAVCTLVGPIVGFVVGRLILKQNAATVLATIGGAQTVMVSLNALQEAAESKVLATSFTLPYAIGNILLTLWGPVIVALSRLWS